MAELTMGQRIAERRKMLNLSQEALGEKMGVSRQAISKWEADSAIPEIDKLIAMSKLFSVSVGWLLGTEESVAENNRESFSEDQMKMVEEIVKRYHQPAPKKDHLIPVIVTGALFLLAVGIAVSLFFENYVNLEMSGIRSQLSNLYSYYASIQSQLGDVSDRLNELAQGENLLSEYTLEATAWEDMSGATVRFTAIPKNTTAGEQAWLSVRLEGKEVANAMCVMDGSAYTASVDLPAADGYSYYFQVVHVGGDSSQQSLTDTEYYCQNLFRAMRGNVYADFEKWEWNRETFSADLWVYRSDPYLYRDDANLEWSQIDLVLLRNGIEIHRMSVLEKFSEETLYGHDGAVIEVLPNEVRFRYEQALQDLKEGEELELQLEFRFAGVPVTVQPVAILWLEDGVLDLSQYAITDK